MEYLDDCITLKQHIDDLLKNDNQPQISMVAEEIGKTVAQLHENSIIHGDLTTSNFLVRLSASGQMSDLLLIDFGLTTVESAHNPEDKGKQTFSVYPQDTHKGIWGLFQSEKSLSLIDRKRLYIINLTFFVWWHECHRFLLKFWLQQFFSCLTPNWNSPLGCFLIISELCYYWTSVHNSIFALDK